MTWEADPFGADGRYMHADWVSVKISNFALGVLIQHDKDKARDIITSTEGVGVYGSLRGHFFENFAHGIMLGGKFRVRNLNDGSTSEESFPQRKMKRFTKVNEAEKGKYNVPNSKTFQSVDSIIPISPATIVHKLVQNRHGPQESSFQVALYSALNCILPETMVCLCETRAEGRTQLDLMVTNSAVNLAGYELKTNLSSSADFNKHFEQVSGYANHYNTPIYLVNFYPKGHSTAAKLDGIPAGVTVVNIMHNEECTNFVLV